MLGEIGFLAGPKSVGVAPSALAIVATIFLGLSGCTDGKGEGGPYKTEPIKPGEKNLLVEAVAVTGGKPVPVKWFNLFRRKQDGAKGDKVYWGSGYSGTMGLSVKDGDYVVQAQADAVVAEMPVEAVKDRRNYYRLVLNAGWVKVRVVAAEDGKQVPV
ncbi:MAG: hypothetical protein D6806_07445, partial [Deltaproteobacteria bacterium]